MAENKDLKLTPSQHEVDENENPSSLNVSSNRTVNDSFNLVNSESEKKCSESEVQHFPDDAFISAGLSTSKKDALVDSGFHCENLEKVLPDLVNNSLCESVDNELANGIHEAKQVSNTSGNSFCLNNDNSFNNSKDESFNTLANTTTNNIALLLERLTLNSDGTPLKSSALPDNLSLSATPKIQPMPTEVEVSLDDNFKHSNQLNVDVNSNGSKIQSLDNSVSPDISLHQPSLPDLNDVPNIESKVPLDETFNAANSVTTAMMNTFVESLDNNASKITNSDSSVFYNKNSLGDSFKHPLPVPESGYEPNVLNITEDNIFSGEPDDNLDGEEFQDAVQFFKDPSTFQVLENIKTTNPTVSSMPRDSLYMTFDPLYRRVIQPTNSASVDMKEKEEFIKAEICGVNSAENIHLVNKHARESLGINLVSFDSPIKNNSVKDSDPNKIPEKTEICNADNVENVQLLVNKLASDVLAPESLSCQLAFDLPQDSSDGNSKKDSRDLSSESLTEEICNVENTQKFVNKTPERKSLSNNLLPFSSPIKNIPDGNSEEDNELNKKCGKEEICCTDNTENDQHVSDVLASPESLDSKLGFDSTLKSSSDESSEKGSGDFNKVSIREEILKKNVPTRESLGGNLLSFESPIRNNSEIVKATPLKKDQKLYTEDEFQQALKIYELTMQETYLKKQKELEEEALKRGSDNTDKLHKTTILCKTLIETVTELALVASTQNAKIGELSSRVKNLESENQELGVNLKTATEDQQSMERTFSDFHKRYVQSKDMLQTYKENEDQLKTHIEDLSKKLEEQTQMCAMLQVKMGEVVDKANAEVATAKKGGDVHIAVLKAQLKKSELKVSSLENDLNQTRIENDKLHSLCDDLMAKVGEV